jgi:hypothetical protein
VPPGASTSGRNWKAGVRRQNAAPQEAGQNCRGHGPIRPAAEGRARGPLVWCTCAPAPTRPRGLGTVCPSVSCKSERDSDAYCREPANDRGEPYDFTSFIED